MYILSWYTRQWIILLYEKKNILKILSEEKGKGDFKCVYSFPVIFPNATKPSIKNYYISFHVYFWDMATPAEHTLHLFSSVMMRF